MPSHKHQALQAFCNVLRRIAPPAYWYDLSGAVGTDAQRVFPTTLYPDSLPFANTAAQWMYVCCPYVDGNERWTSPGGGTLYEREFFLHALIFVNELESALIATSEPDALGKAEDDVFLAVLNNPNLDRTVISCKPVGCASDAGWPRKSKRWGESIVTFRCTQTVDKRRLGPGGV